PETEPGRDLLAAEEPLRERAPVVQTQEGLVQAGRDDGDDGQVVGVRKPQVAATASEVDAVAPPEWPERLPRTARRHDEVLPSGLRLDHVRIGGRAGEP